MYYFLMVFLFSGLVSAKEKISLVTYPIPMMVESESKGVFIDFAHKLFADSDVEFDLIMLPRIRALDYFRTKKETILFPAVGDEISGGTYLKTVTFFEKRDYLFFRKGQHYSTLKSLHGKVVGITLGYPYSKDALNAKGVSFETAPNDEANFKKLELKRIDAFLTEETTGLHALNNAGVKNITYDKDRPVSRLPAHFALHDNAEG